MEGGERVGCGGGFGERFPGERAVTCDELDVSLSDSSGGRVCAWCRRFAVFMV